MSQFPIESEAGLYEAINYLASGPAGLGQNFEGFVSYDPAYLTSYYRAPFALPTSTTANVAWYSTPLSISTITAIDEYTFEVTFASAQPSAPYSIGQGVYIKTSTAAGANPNVFNGYWTPPGVVTCSTTSVIIQTATPKVWTTGTGGTIQLDASDDYVSTDANGRVKVYGPNDQVFVSGQIDFDFDYTSSATGSVDVYAAINRYTGFLDTSDPTNPDYLFASRKTLVEKLHTITIPSSGTGTITGQEFVFTTFIDTPTYTTKVDGVNITKGYGYYWYILELYFDSSNGSGATVYPTRVTANLRSLTAQVIKQ